MKKNKPHRDARKDDPGPLRVAPHKKPKVWRLTVEWSETRTYRRDKVFPSKAARDEARGRIERHFREAAAKPQPPKRVLSWYYSPFTEFGDEVLTHLKTEPQYIETYEEGKL